MIITNYIKRLFQLDKKNSAIQELLQTAISYKNIGNLEEAKNTFHEILREKPDHADSLYHLGVISGDDGKIEEAIQLISQAIEVNNNIPDYYYALGQLLKRQGRKEEALIALERALMLDPEFYDAQILVGLLFKESWLLEDAKAAFENAIKIKSNDAEVYNYLGLTLLLLRMFDEAKSTIEKAIQLNPDFAPAYNNLGALLQTTGDFDGAETAYTKALRLFPDNPHSIAALANLKKYTKADIGFINNAESVLNKLGDNDNKQILHYALGKMLDDCGEFDRAFLHYEKANNLGGEKYHLDPETEEEKFTEIIKVFTPEFFKQCNGFGSNSNLPVFIVGMPRSGTSLVEQILASHPEIFGAGELLQIGNITKRLHETLVSDEQYPECVLEMDNETSKSIAAEYLSILKNFSRDAIRITDKMPANFVHLGLIAVLFPNAFIIHCRRDPLDTCLSMYFNNMAGPQGYSFQLSDVGYWYRQYERLMEHWDKCLPLQILDIRYEELINNQEQSIHKLLEYLKLDWNDNCITFQNTNRTVLTASNWQVKQPLYNSSLYRWKNYEKYLDKLKEVLNYN